MSDMAVSHARHRVTVEEYHRMGDASVFAPGARIELLDGELFETLVPMNPPHAVYVRSLTRLLTRALADRALVSPQLPITLGDYSEPEPDIAIIRAPDSLYVTRHPGPQDVLAVIEVSESSRNLDLRRKVPIYAAHGIPETWIVDLIDTRVRIFRNPGGTEYGDVSIASFEDLLSLTSFPDVRVRLADLLRPA